MLGSPSVEAVHEKVAALELKRGGSQTPAAWASELTSFVARGGFASVYRRDDDKGDYIMKVTHYDSSDPGKYDQAQTFQRQEVAAMARLELAGVHGVVRVKGWTAERDDELKLAMFLSDEGRWPLSLIRRMLQGPNAPAKEYQEAMVNDVMGQLFQTLVNMHESGGVTHNDLNGRNVVLRAVCNHEGKMTSIIPTIIDFGSATLVDENGRSPLAPGYTPEYMDPMVMFTYTDMVNGEAKNATDFKHDGWLTDAYALTVICCKIYGWSISHLNGLKETTGDANPAFFEVAKQVLALKWGDRLSREELQNTPWYKSWKHTTAHLRPPGSPVIVASAGSGQPFVAPSGIPVGGQIGAAGAVGLAASRPIKEEPMPAAYSPGIVPPPLAGIQPRTGGDGNGHTASYWRRSSGSEAEDLPHRPPIRAEPDGTAGAAQEAAQGAAQASAGNGKRKSGEVPDWEKQAEPLTEHELYMTSGNATAEEINDFIYGSGVQNRGASRSASPVGDPEMPDSGAEVAVAVGTVEGPGMVPAPPTEGGGIVHRAKPKDASGPGQASVAFERVGASESPAPRRMPTRSVTARAKEQASGPAYSTRSVAASKRKAEDDAAGSGAGGRTEAERHGRRRGGGKKRKASENAKIDSSNVSIEARRRKKPTPHAGGKAKATVTVTASKATCRDRTLKRKDRDEDGDSGDDDRRRATGCERSGTQAATKRSRPSARAPGRDV